VLEQWMRSCRPEEMFDTTGDVHAVAIAVERQHIG
jgi:hypothetical protein